MSSPSVTASFGYWVRRRRQALDVTQAVLARRVGCSPETISKIERDLRRPSRQMANLLADRLDVAEAERETFIAAGLGERAVDRLPLTDKPLDIAATDASNPPKLRHNLPAQPTPFIGRQGEMTSIEALLVDPNVRLVTIVGPGGMGKSRLALAVAERLVDSPDLFAYGIFTVSLTALPTVAQIAPAIAHALDFQLESGERQTRTPEAQLLDYLRNKRVLLLLDNFEHLLDGAEFVATMAASAPQVQVLVTSRERLNLREEQLYPLYGLPFPGQETTVHVADYAALQLFLTAARRVQPDFDVQPTDMPALIQLCRLVEGMPLAVELVAGWVDMLSLREIAAELERGLDLLETDKRNVSDRHRSMRALFDATWRRLGPDEQTALARLSVFRGGFTRAAAKAVAGASLIDLAALANKSLLRYERERDRYSLHELIRQYAALQLAGEPENEDGARDCHAEFYAELSAQQASEMRGARQRQASAVLSAEQSNLRCAWERAVEQSRADLLDLAQEGLGRFYDWNGRYEEGADLFRLAACSLDARSVPLTATKLYVWQALFLEKSGDPTPAQALLAQCETLLQDPLLCEECDAQTVRASILYQLGRLARIASDPEACARYLERSLKLFRSSGDDRGEARVLAEQCFLFRNFGTISTVDQRRRQLHLAERAVRQSLEICREIEDRMGMANALNQLGSTLYYLGQLQEARSALEESRRHCDAIGVHSRTLLAYNTLSILLCLTGEYEQALSAGMTALTLAQEAGYQSEAAGAIRVLGWLKTVEGALEEAQKLLAGCLKTYRQIGNPHEVAHALHLLAVVDWKLGQRTSGLDRLAETLRIVIRLHAIAPLGIALCPAAIIYADCDRAEQAVEFFALHRYFFSDAHIHITEDLARPYLKAAIERLTDEEVATARARGRARNLWTTAHEILADVEHWLQEAD